MRFVSQTCRQHITVCYTDHEYEMLAIQPLSQFLHHRMNQQWIPSCIVNKAIYNIHQYKNILRHHTSQLVVGL